MLRVVALSLAWAVQASPLPPPEEPPAAAGPTVEWRGRIVCLDEAAGRRPCEAEGRRFALETAEGTLHRIRPEDPLAGVFGDRRVRERELVVKVRPRPEGAAELIKVYSVKHEKVHDLRYFCELCNITAFVPGPCPCCRDELELRETPVP